jgi:LAS superfamily LD-carboxypeptidase LdcB
MSKLTNTVRKVIPSKKYPAKKVVVPADLKGVENGKIPPRKLGKTVIGARLWRGAVPAFDRMYEDAKAAGITFVNVGDYRTYARQLAMFKDRYARKDQGRVPKVTRVFEGKVYYLKPGKSPSAVPGTSNHGLGMAIDLAVKVGNETKPLGSSPVAERWLRRNGPKYGFYLQSSNPNSPEFEIWHWQYCEGDNTPPALQ